MRRPLAALTAPFRLDLRSLALFRIAIGALILIDLAIRSADLEAHYTDAGVLPRDRLGDPASRAVWFSIYFAAGHTNGAALLFFLHASLAVLLILGLRTRLATILSWIMLVSLHSRNPLVLNAGDTLFRMCLFWSMFLPLGARFSVDARHHSTRPNDVLSAGTVAFTLQLCSVYWFSAAWKTGGAWSNGTALYYALHLDLFAKPAGLWLREVDWLLPTLTLAALQWERFGPLLLFSPMHNDRFRLLAIGGFVIFHLAINATLAVGLFSAVCIVAWLPFIPGVCWTRLAGLVPASTRQRTAAVAATAGEPEAAPPSPARGTIARRAATAFAVASLAYVLAWNLRTLDVDRWAPYFSKRWNIVADLLRIDQKWNMFSPSPSKHDGWYVAAAMLESGEEIDLRTGSAVSWTKPDLVAATFPNRRWGKYLMRLRQPEHVAHRPFYARYLARQWNAAHGERRQQVTALALFFVEERTPPAGNPEQHPTRLWYERLTGPNVP
jgi:hypothetical protein